MIGVPSQNCRCSIKLFAGHYPDKLMRPGRAAEANDLTRHGVQGRVQPVWSADDQRINRSRCIPRPPDVLGPFRTCYGRASLVEQNQVSALSNSGKDRGGFLRSPLLGPASSRFIDFSDVDGCQACSSRTPREKLQVAIEEQTLRSRLEFSNANKREAHGAVGPSALSRIPWTIRAPHLFQIIESPNVGAKDMHDSVFRIQ
jgi:hypothetical protein